MIASFRGAHGFLSNFALLDPPIRYEGIVYTSTEAAFQAAKTLDLDERKVIAKLSPGQSKKMGSLVKLRPDWEAVKLQVMYDVNWQKYCDLKFAAKLLATAGHELVEGNDWGDTYWGVCRGIVGDNHLGKILMRIRDELQDALDMKHPG